MKTKSSAKLVILTAGLSCLASSMAFAAGRETGNGGGGEILFHDISTQIQSWMKIYLADGTLGAKLQLQDSKVAPDQLAKIYQDTIVATPDVKFIPNASLDAVCKQGDEGACLLEQNPSRVCVNHSAPNYIRCNDDLFENMSGDIQFSINLHEYLGVAGIEKNGMSDIQSYSQYPISKYLMQYASPKSVVRYELGPDNNSAGSAPAVTSGKYEVLKGAFDSASHANLSEFPRLSDFNEPGPSWKCIGESSDSDGNLKYIPDLKVSTYQIMRPGIAGTPGTPGKAAVPAKGPLFPGSPEVPEVPGTPATPPALVTMLSPIYSFETNSSTTDAALTKQMRKTFFLNGENTTTDEAGESQSIYPTFYVDGWGNRILDQVTYRKNGAEIFIRELRCIGICEDRDVQASTYAYCYQTTPPAKTTVQGKQIGKITDRETGETLILSKDENKLHFYFSSKEGILGEMTSLAVDKSGSKVRFTSGSHSYTFEMMQKLAASTGKMLTFWFDDNSDFLAVGLIFSLGMMDAAVLSVAVAPVLLGVALSPIDGALTLGHHLFDSDQIAARKLNQMMRGRTVKINHRSFEAAVQNIRRL